MKRHTIFDSAKLFVVVLVFAVCLDVTRGMVLNMSDKALIRIPQTVWRQAARQHQEQIRTLLSPGLTTVDKPTNMPGNNKGDWASGLNLKHPVYNFLIEYYGLKGTKGPRRLARWSPSPSLLLQDTLEINSLEQLQELSGVYNLWETSCSTADDRAVLLEGATEDDFGTTLHLKGATSLDNEGITYSPSQFFGRNDPSRKEQTVKSSSAFIWNKAVLEQTLKSEPVLHCYGLHEWAMQYQPEGALPPPSAKYQAHLQLRIPRDVINETVERKGISCTHVDALRFFAQDALPLNDFGGSLQRADQVRLEQPGCVHAHMDLLKIALKLQPFCDPVLLQRVLEVALAARRLDVAASPYDSSEYGVGVIPIETAEGRAEYRTQQLALMKRVQPVRQDLLDAYNCFLSLAFDEGIMDRGVDQ
jgi:hypothetical protein